MPSMIQKIVNANTADRKFALKNDLLSQSASKLKPTPYSYEQPKVLSSSIQKIVEQNNIDRALLIKNDRIGQTARPRINRVKKNMTGVDEDILKEYQSEHPQSFEYIDELGETKYRKYLLPNSKPDLLPDEQYAPPELLEERLGYLEIDKGEMLTDMKTAEGVLAENLKLQEEYKKYINSGATSGLLGVKRNMALKDLPKLEEEEERIRNHMRHIQQELEDTEKRKKMENERYAEHNSYVAQIKKINKETVDRYRDELNFLNKGAFSTEKADNESEMEYLERLQRNAEIQAPDFQLQDAKNATASKFRIKMKELIRDPVIIEQVLNSLDSFGEVDNKAILLKSWNLVKSRFIQTYGANNTSITASEILAFFKYFLEIGESGLSKAVETLLGGNKSEQSQAQLGFRDTLEVFPFQAEDYLLISHQTAGGQKTLFLRSVTDGTPNLKLLYSFNGNSGTFKQYFDKELPYNRSGRSKPLSQTENRSGVSKIEIERETGIKPEKLNGLFDLTGQNVSPSLIARKMMDKYGIRPTAFTSDRVSRTPYSITKSGEKRHVEYGMGLHAEEIPARVPFGSSFILLKKLYYHNELSVKNKQDKSIAGLRTTKVSEPFVKLIMNMVNGIHPTHGDLNHLSSIERQLYDRLIQVSNLNKSVPHHGDKTVQELKKRLKLIEGEINIGNDNPMLIKEVYSILHSLKDFKVLTQNQINDYMKQFK